MESNFFKSSSVNHRAEPQVRRANLNSTARRSNLHSLSHRAELALYSELSQISEEIERCRASR